MSQLYFPTLTEQLLKTTYPNGRIYKWKDVIEKAKKGQLVVAICDDPDIRKQMIEFMVRFIGKEKVAVRMDGAVLIRKIWGGVVLANTDPTKDVLNYNKTTTYYYIYEETDDGKTT